MTIQNQFKQRFPVDGATYWRDICLNLEYQEQLYREALGCTHMDVVELDGSFESGMSRRLRFKKRLDAPAAVRKVFGDTVTLEEVSRFDAKEQRWHYQMVPGVLADRIDIRGVLHLVEGEEGVEQVSDNSVTCKIFGVGAVVEHFVAKSSLEGNIDKANFTRRYISERGLAVTRIARPAPRP